MGANESAGRNPGEWDSRSGGLCGILFGGLVIATFAVSFGFLVFAAGFAVYGFATVRGRPFPRWLGYVGILGAVLFLLGALPVSGAFTAILVGTVLILGWMFASSGLLWRSGTPRAAP